MKLFIGLEGQLCTENGLSKILNEVKEKLKFLNMYSEDCEKTNEYGSEFNFIGIIPTCIDDAVWDSLGWKERRLFRRKKGEVDIRLKMDYNRFINETPENKRLLFIDVLIKSIQEVQKGSRIDFRGDDLINDILTALDVSMEDLVKLNSTYNRSKISYRSLDK